jgi:sigma-B regulation protein RsbU (phosphoserine phosphatase)
VVPIPGLSEAIIAALIIAMAMLALAFGVSRWRAGDRTAIWFGLFGCLYGIRLAGYFLFLQSGLTPVSFRYLDAFITYAIVVPGALFVESLFGKGWRSTLHRTWQVATAYALLAIVIDVVRHDPGAMRWLNAPVVLTVVGIALAHLAAEWRHIAGSREFRMAAAGGLVFVGAATYQTLGGTLRIEHYAMLVFMLSVGYFVAQRMLKSERQHVAMSRELELARQIQRSILPRECPQMAGLTVAASYLPMSAIGGDFYDFNTEQADRLSVIVADASGHGVPAALVASMVKMAFAAEAERLDDSGLMLTNMNRRLCGTFHGAFVTACCVFIDTRHRTLTYANAGHPPPLLRRNNGQVEHLPEHGVLLAFDPRAGYASAEVDLRPGDRLVLFSDGLMEASNARDEYFGDARLEHVVATSAATTPQQFVDEMIAELRQWTGPETPLQDDVTLVVIDVGDTAR